jgi:hypothetical protein
MYNWGAVPHDIEKYTDYKEVHQFRLMLSTYPDMSKYQYILPGKTYRNIESF